MDRRFGSRQPVAVDVVLYDRGEPVCLGKARDVSLLGMFLQARGLRVRKHRIVEVEFNPGGACSERVPAMVMRPDDEGLGLIFDTSDDDTRSAVRAILKRQGAQRESG